MTEPTNGAAGVRVGANPAAVVQRLLVLDYYDGATEGVMEFGPTREAYHFRWVDAEHPTGEALRRRTYVLHPMPADSLDRLAIVLAPHLKPNWPAWFPIWRFPSESIRQRVEAETDAILAEAGPATWLVETDDPFTISHFTATRLSAEPVARD
jgi:hypothetical protein